MAPLRLLPTAARRHRRDWEKCGARRRARPRALLGQTESERYGQLLFEVVKTRSALFHSLDQNLSAPVVDEIIEASEKSAQQYITRLAGAEEAKQ